MGLLCTMCRRIRPRQVCYNIFGCKGGINYRDPDNPKNRNNFDIVVHLLSEGEQERVSDNIPVGGCHSFLGTTDKEYTVGVHADVDEGTEIKVFVYDGEKTDPYINTKP